MAARKFTILVVDDDEPVRMVLGRWVQTLGHGLLAASSAEEAVELLEKNEVDLALLDVKLPGALDGIWLSDMIRKHYPHIAVILVTGLQTLDAGVARRPGVVAHVVKPFVYQEISNAIKTGLNWRARKAS